MSKTSEILARLQIALAKAEASSKALEEARAGLKPLEEAAEQDNNAASILYNEWQSAMIPDVPAPQQKAARGGAGKKRGPRSFNAVGSTAATRLLNEEHKAGKKKAQSLNAAIERVSVLASAKGEKVTDELRASISERADEIWGSKK